MMMAMVSVIVIVHWMRNHNGVDHLIINKLDVLEQLNCWNIYDPNTSINKILNFESKDSFKDYIRNQISSICSGIEIEFQESPH